MLACLHSDFSHDAQVESYLDTGEGVVSALPEGRCWVNEEILQPRMTFDARQEVTAAAITHIHELA